MSSRLSPTALTAHTLDYMSFLDDSPSPYHAATLVAQRLEDLGFARQDERAAWDASPGGHVMVRDGAVMAWVLPATIREDTAFRIVGAHTDSPTFRLKPTPTSRTGDGWGQIEVEVYGGMLFNSWLDRELSFAGRIISDEGGAHLVRTGALARIPQLAVHLDRGVNSEGVTLDPQRHLHPVWSVNPSQGCGTADAPGAGDNGPDLVEVLARSAGLAGREQVAAMDVVAATAQGAAVFGLDGEFVAAGRQDNLSSVHAGLRALERLVDTGLPTSGDVLVLACFDHEEVGSESATGAAGPILSDVLTRTASALGRDADGLARMIAGSFCVSADAAHSVHPNYADRHDPRHHPVMGSGPVLKINANQRYASDGRGIARWRGVCRAAGIPSQDFVSNNAVPCGSTIGPITATRLGVRTVDVGIPLLSMHSAREMSHRFDLLGLSLALESFWSLPQGAHS